MKIQQNRHWPFLCILILIPIPMVWNGFACIKDPCIHGVCVDDLVSEYFCYCIDGYTGIQCQTNWNECWSSPCQNGGICIDGIASFNCSCPPGYIGDLCEENVNECRSNPCINNGTCIDAANNYFCTCMPGYSGTHCEIDEAVCNSTDEVKCFNGGTCQEGPGTSFACVCREGWTGSVCDIEINECMSDPCQNGGVCIDLHADYLCACTFGYSGRNCEDTIHICDNNPCKNGALCLLEEGRPVCYCVPDFHGEHCEFQYDECQLGKRCLNGGTCVDGIDNFTCSCPPPLTGVLCECLILLNNTLDCNYLASTTTEAQLVTIKEISVTTHSSRATPEEVTFSSVTLEMSTNTIETIETTQRAERTELPQELANATSAFTETTLPPSYWMTTASSLMTTEETTSLSTLFTTVFEPENITVYTQIAESVPSPKSFESTSTIQPIESTTLTEEGTIIEIYSSSLPSTFSSVTSSTTESTTESSFAATSEIETEYTTTTYYSNATLFTSTFPEVSTTEEISPESTLTEIVHTVISTTTTSKGVADESTFAEKTSLPVTISESSNVTYSSQTLSEFFPSVTPSTTISFEIETSSDEGKAFQSGTTTTITSEGRTEGRHLDECGNETPCQGPGICTVAPEEQECTCDSDTSCERKLPFANVAFTGHSYITHRLINRTHVLVEFDAKTMMKNGLLFHLNIDTAYMVLYIEEGDLKLKFSCGYQTMLLSELNIFVTNGYNMNIKASLNFTRDFSRCMATIKMNNSLSMIGDQKAKVDIFFSSPVWLHLGRLPGGLGNEENFPIEGFVGCMSNLKISSKKVKIYEDSEESFEVRDCASLVCLSNPCKNGAQCTPVGDSWRCHCKNGYLGTTCDISICDDNPCLYGGTCLPFTSGYICLCPFGKHGHFCENDLKITEPYFSSTVRGLSSYVAYPFPALTSKSFEIRFRISPTTIDQISLLLFIGQTGYHSYYSDHLAVTFVKGYIMLTWNLGSGPRRIFTSEPIENDAKEYLVCLGHRERQAWLFVENIGNITGKSPGSLIQLDITPLLFIGGHPSRNFSELPHDLPLHSGFSGCIFDLEIRSDNIIIPFQSSAKTFGRSVGQCGINECYDGSCQNGGACLHHGSTFMCLCQDNWYGPLCISKNNICDNDHSNCSRDSRCVPALSGYECDCPFGKTGTFCEKSDVLSEVGFSGQRSYLALNPIEMETGKLHIEMEIRIFKDEGILFYIEKSNYNFVCLSLMGGVIELRIQTGVQKTKENKLETTMPDILRSSRILVKAAWHKVKFGIFGRKIYLVVDEKINSGLLKNEPVMRLSKEEIFIGGLPDLSELPFLASPVLPVSFKGCLRHLSIDKSLISTHTIRESRNLVECDGTPCDGEACLNGGTCWLDSFMKPHCSCVAPFYGDKCENLPKCINDTCQNGGKCILDKCSCTLGWKGNFCEKKVKIKVPEFNGKSYMLIKKKPIDKQEMKRLNFGNINMNFSTTSLDGLILWSRKNDSFIGIGLEKGHLKLTYSMKNKTFVEVTADRKLSDGLWHSVEVNFNRRQLKIDGIPMNTILDIIDDSLANNKEFYLGGLPTKKKVIEETGGLYHKSFEGCLESFGNDNLCIKDFTNYDGENIDVCSSF